MISFYQKYLSLDSGIFRHVFSRFIFISGDRTCRFTPSCSDYTYRAIERYGIITGLRLGLSRIIRCNPMSAGGYDPVK